MHVTENEDIKRLWVIFCDAEVSQNSKTCSNYLEMDDFEEDIQFGFGKCHMYI